MKQHRTITLGACLFAVLVGGCDVRPELDDDADELSSEEYIDTAAGAVQPGAYSIIAKHSGKCLDIGGASPGDKGLLFQHSCHSGLNQRFQLLDLGGGEWAIIAQHSNKCLDMPGATTADGAQVEQYTCHFGANQRFRFVDFGGGEYAIAVQHSGKCLDVQAASLADTAPVVQYICHAGANQRFRLQ